MIDILVSYWLRAEHPELRTRFTRSQQARLMRAGRDLFGLCKDGSEFPIEIRLNPVMRQQPKIPRRSSAAHICFRRKNWQRMEICGEG